MEAQGVDLELIEAKANGLDIVVPNRVRLNGQEVLIPAGADITISPISSTDVVTVTMTMMVRSLSIHTEDVPKPYSDQVVTQRS